MSCVGLFLRTFFLYFSIVELLNQDMDFNVDDFMLHAIDSLINIFLVFLYHFPFSCLLLDGLCHHIDVK